MKRSLTIAAMLLLIFCTATTAISAEYTPETLPKVHLQDKTRYAINPDGILSPSAVGIIDTMLYNLENKTGIETVVAAVESIGQQECFDFCHNLLNSWGVGKKEKDNGLVILLVTDQRCIQFYTGYGLEGDLPDAICKRIQTTEMIPYLKNDEWDRAMINGVQAVCRRLDTVSEKQDAAPVDNTGLLIMLLLLFIIIAIAVYKTKQITRASRTCPKCGKHQLQPTESRIQIHKDGKDVTRIIYKCGDCGYTVARDDDTDNDDTPGDGGRRSSGSLWNAILLGSLLGGLGRGRGGGFGGGGFGGGDFGGGAGGGGGAGSRF